MAAHQTLKFSFFKNKLPNVEFAKEKIKTNGPCTQEVFSPRSVGVTIFFFCPTPVKRGD